MSARDALREMRERYEDTHMPPRGRGVGAFSMLQPEFEALVEVVEAVADLADSIQRARFMRVEMSTDEIHTRLTGALNKMEGR